MEHKDAFSQAENLLGLAKFTIEFLSPSHRLATYNLEEIYSAFKHDFRNRRTRLKCVPTPESVLKSFMSPSEAGNYFIDEAACAVVGTKAAISLGVPVGGSCWAFASKCFCTLSSRKDCGPRCRTWRKDEKGYAVLIVASRKVPLYQILVNDTTLHNIKTFLFGISALNENNCILNLKRCDYAVKGFLHSPKIAVKAVVSWIECPEFSDNNMLLTSINGFFHTPRHLHKGDIFKINLSEHAPEVVLSPGTYGVKELYFLVKDIEGPRYSALQSSEAGFGYLVKKGDTTLMQEMNAQSFLPCVLSSNSSQASKFIPNHPEGLRKTYEKLISSLIPFLKGSSSGLNPAFLLSGPAGSGKRRLMLSAAAQLGLQFWTIDGAEIRGSTSGQTVGKLKAVFSKAKRFAPCIIYMSNIQVLSRDQDGQEDLRVFDEFGEQLSDLKTSKFPLILVASVTSSTDLSGSFARLFLLEITIPVLEKEDRTIQLKQLLAQHNATASEESLEEVASKCSGFLLGDLTELVSLTIRNHLYDNLQLEQSVNNTTKCALTLTIHSFELALDNMQTAYAGCIGAPKIPSVKWKDVGGLENVKKEIIQTVTLPLKHPELVAGGLARTGILLYGPPGTGKTLLAKAVATECNLNFLSVKGPELLNMYVGQSEANVREVFERARGASPCIIFFDELDALAPNRGRSGDSGGVMDRVVSQLSSEMDGLQKKGLLFLIGATNRPDLIDPALLRPGRFDKLLYVGTYEDASSKCSVLSALTRKFKLNSNVDLKALSTTLPQEVTGADLYAVCSSAWLEAVRRIINFHEKGKEKLKTDVEVNQEDFAHAISKMVPSVSPEDMEYFRGLRKQFCS